MAQEEVKLTSVEKVYLLKAARQALAKYFLNTDWLDYNTDNPALLQKRATFVTLRKKDTRELRGCRGETLANKPLIKSILKTTIASAIDDPRFKPVAPVELDNLMFEINALTPLKQISTKEIEVGKHGLMIVNGYSAGLLLPQVPVSYKWDKETYLVQLCKKAGLAKSAWKNPESTLYGFESEEWGENEFDL